MALRNSPPSRPDDSRLAFGSGDAHVVVDAEAGGRVASLSVAGHELLVAEEDVGDPRLWGCYPMVPWAGRVRDGRFRFRGTDHRLPLDAPPHAIHGVGLDRAWEVTGPDTVHLALDRRWPFGGEAVQRFVLAEHSLTLTMTVTAGEQAMPVMAGWHPCFRRQLTPGDPVVLDVDAGEMWERDRTGIPTGRLVPVPEGPWDDAFARLGADPTIDWAGTLALRLRSSCPVWVVYDQDPRLVCVEPQTDAPDAFNRDPRVLEPGERLEISLTIDWTPR